MVGYGGDMRKTKTPTAAELALLEQGWLELGQSIAETVVVCGKKPKWAWDLIGPLGIYKRWMLDSWIARYRDEHPEHENQDANKDQPPKQRKVPAAMQSKFTKRDQIREALALLNAQTGR